MKLRELTTTEANPLDAMKTGAQKAAGAVKAAAGKVAQKGADMAVGAVANATGASKDDVKAAAQQQGGVAGKVAGMASGADKQAAQKTAQGAKMATSAMGAKGGSGAQMAKGLDKLASGGALQGNLAKQIAPFAKQLTTILGDQAMRQKFMMLVKQAEKGAAPAESSNYTPTKDKDDYDAKKKALQDIQTNPETSKDPELKKELMKRKAALDKDKPVDEADHIMQLAKLVSGTSETQQNQASDFANEMKALAGIKTETATAGATSAGNIASVANPAQAYGHRPKDSKGLPKAPQKKKADGTAVNALDMGNNLMGGSTVKR